MATIQSQTGSNFLNLDGEIRDGKVIDFNKEFKINSQFTPNVPDEEIFYFIDFTKLTNVNDLIVVLQALGLGLSNKHPHFNLLQSFLDLNKPVKLK